MDNPFSWDYMKTVPGPNEVFGPFSIAYLIMFVAGFVLSIVVYNGWAKKWFTDPVLHRMARKWSGIAIVIFGLGLFFFLIRWLQINPFGMARRYWLWLSLLALMVLIGYAIWDYKTHYQALRAQYEEQQRRRQTSRSMAHAASGGKDRSKSPVAAPAGPKPRPVKRRRK
jgi:phosphoglycerol transferase MdoB-like AlkP superfamily enzyme